MELLTGRRSVDKSRPNREQKLADWARPQLKDPRKLRRIMDPRLEGLYSEEGVQKAALVAYQCLSHRPKARPEMSTVVKTFKSLKDYKDISTMTFVYIAPVEDKELCKESPQREVKKRNTNSHHRRSRQNSTINYPDKALHKKLSPNSPLRNDFHRA